MGDFLAKGKDFEMKAEKKLRSRYGDAADLFDKAATYFRLANSWDRAGAVCVKLASCHLKLDSKHEAAKAYADAANCYKESNIKESISCLEQSANLFLDIGELIISASYYKEIADLYNQEQNLVQAIDYYERAAHLFQSKEVTTSANQCKQKIAQPAAQLEQYQKSIEIDDEITRQTVNNLLERFGVKGHRLESEEESANQCKQKIAQLAAQLEQYQKFIEIYDEITRQTLNILLKYGVKGHPLDQEQNLVQAIDYYERAADLFQSEEVTTSANQCKQKIAQLAAQLEQYQKSIKIYEEIARQSLNNNLLKYGVKGHLLNAGICQLCKCDVVAINKALERYQELDPTFSGTWEYKLLADLAAAIDEEDVAKFTDAVKEFDSMTQLDAWKKTLLLRVKEALKAKELEEDDLT